MTRATSPVLRLLVALVGAALFLLSAGLLAGGPARAQAPAPAPAPADTATAPADTAPATAVSVGVTDRAGLLSAGDDDLLRTETPRVDFPPQVRHVEYLVFDDGGSNLNDTTLEFAEDERPDLLAEDRKKWAPGTLIVSNDAEARDVGLYCGDDVCVAMDLFEGSHLDGSLEAMKDPMRRDNTAVGLLAGAKAAVTDAQNAYANGLKPQLYQLAGTLDVVSADIAKIRGDLSGAAALTNDPVAAEEALTASDACL